MKKILLTLWFINSTLSLADLPGDAPDFKPARIPGLNLNNLNAAELHEVRRLQREGVQIKATPSSLLGTTSEGSSVLELNGFVDSKASFEENSKVNVRYFVEWYVRAYAKPALYGPLLVIPYSLDANSEDLYSRLRWMKKTGLIPSGTVIATMATLEQIVRSSQGGTKEERGRVWYLLQNRSIEGSNDAWNNLLTEASNRGRTGRRALFGGSAGFEVTRFVELATSLPFDLREETPTVHLDLFPGCKPAEGIGHDDAAKTVLGLVKRYPSLGLEKLKLSRLSLKNFGLFRTPRLVPYSGSGKYFSQGIIHDGWALRIAEEVLEAKIYKMENPERSPLEPEHRWLESLAVQKETLRSIQEDLNSPRLKPPVER